MLLRICYISIAVYVATTYGKLNQSPFTFVQYGFFYLNCFYNGARVMKHP